MAIGLVVVLLAGILLYVVRVAPDKVRFVVLDGGQFRTLKGPGLLLKPPRAGVTWVRLTIGDRGNLVSAGLADFNGVLVPVEVSSKKNGPAIRISGFRERLVIVEGVV